VYLFGALRGRHRNLTVDHELYEGTEYGDAYLRKFFGGKAPEWRVLRDDCDFDNLISDA
jgi:hypothetical protein